MDFKLLNLVAQNAIEEKAFPGGVLISGNNKGIDLEFAFGNHTYDLSSPKTQIDNYFDLASLTKVIATTPAIMYLIYNKQLNLHDPIKKYLPDIWFINDSKKSEIQIIDLLAHCSGLIPCCPLEVLNNKNITQDKVWQFIYSSKLLFLPKTNTLYSDIGFIMLGKIIEIISGVFLNEFVEKYVFLPLKMHNSTYKPKCSISKIVPTEFTSDGILLHGVVHDECARILKVPCGHTGIFSNSHDIAKYAQSWLENSSSIEYIAQLAEKFAKKAQIVENSTRALGWDTVSFKNKNYSSNIKFSAGNYINSEAFGHTGFVGNSLWISREYNRYMILLTNQVYPKRDNTLLSVKHYWRNKLNNVAWELLGYKELNNLPKLPIE